MTERKGEAEPTRVIAISTGTIVRTIVIFLMAGLLYLLRDIVAIFLAAGLLAALLDPFATRVQRAGLPRGLAVAVVYVVLLALIVGAFLLVVPPMIAEVGALAQVFSPLIAHSSLAGLQTFLESGVWSQGLESIAFTIQRVGVLQALPEIGNAASGAVGAIFTFFLVLVLAFYLVVEERLVRRAVAFLAPAEYQPFVTQLTQKMQEKIGLWLRAQLLVMIAVFAIVYVALLIIGVPYALVLALFAGLLEVIPFIGPIVAVVPAAIIGFSVSPLHAVLVMVAYFLIQQLEGHVLVPKIMQRTTGLNPILSILSILIGYQLGGIVAAILAIPVAMIISVFLSEVYRITHDHPQE